MLLSFAETVRKGNYSAEFILFFVTTQVDSLKSALPGQSWKTEGYSPEQLHKLL
jgi:hypothetical protein